MHCTNTTPEPDLQLAGGRSVYSNTQQLPIVVPARLDPGLTIKRALNAGYQGLGTIH